MDKKLIYTDYCSKDLENKINNNLNLNILLMYSHSTWNINDVLRILTNQEIVLIVINTINEMTLMEMALANFLCKPILLTAKDSKEYPLVEKTVNYIDTQASLKNQNSSFIEWYKYYRS